MAANIRLIQLYIDTVNKQIVSVSGSPSQIPNLFYGDKPTFQIFPVAPTSSGVAGTNSGPLAGTSYGPVNLANFTMNITLGPTPSATIPQASIASLDSMNWDVTSQSFIGTIDLTTTTVRDFIGNAASGTCLINFDVFDATLNRTTLFQSTSANVTISASIDTPAAGPAGPSAQFPTLQQLLGIFVQIGAFPGKFIEFQSQDGTKTRTLVLDNFGNPVWQ